MIARAIEFVPVTSAHLPLLREWLQAPHLREWWGDPEVELGYILDMIEGRDTTRPFLFQVEGQPVGYIQYWFIGDWQNEPWITDNPWLRELPPETIGVDLSIGRADLLSQGIGAAVLEAFAKRLADAGHRSIIIDPDPRNHRAVRAYTKAGFRPVAELLGRTGDTLIMRFDPNVREPST